MENQTVSQPPKKAKSKSAAAQFRIMFLLIGIFAAGMLIFSFFGEDHPVRVLATPALCFLILFAMFKGPSVNV